MDANPSCASSEHSCVEFIATPHGTAASPALRRSLLNLLNLHLVVRASELYIDMGNERCQERKTVQKTRAKVGADSTLRFN